MKYKKILTSIIVIFLLANYFVYFRVLLDLVLQSPSHHLGYFEYSTLHGHYKSSEDPYKGASFSSVERVFGVYKNCHPTTPDTVLYRTFEKTIWEPWNWALYLTADNYQLPYLDPKLIKPLGYKVPCNCPNKFSAD